MLDSSITSALHRAGVAVTGGDATHITYRFNGHETDAAVVRFGRVTDAGAVRRRAGRLNGSRVLVVCNSIRPDARHELLGDGSPYDLYVISSGELVISGTVASPPTTPAAANNAGHRRMRRNAILRMAILATESLRQQDVASALGVSQQAISRMHARSPIPATPMSPGDREQALGRLLSEAAPPSIETYWYGLEAPTQLVNRALRVAADANVAAGVSGEVAADHLQPWRVPRRALVYSAELLDLTRAGLVAANPEEASLTLRVPRDTTVWGTARWWNEQAGGEPTMDPVIVSQDLAALPGGEDGAPHRLNEWIVNR